MRKYPSLKSEISMLGEELSKHPALGTALGNGCYKIRLSISSKGKGKAGGARIITYILIAESTVFLLSIYDKSEKSDITNTELQNLLKQIE